MSVKQTERECNVKVSIYENNLTALFGRISRINEYSENKACNISIAIDNGKDAEGNKREPSYISVKSFTPAVYKTLTEGMLVQMIGHIAASSYTDAKGEKRYSQDIIADTILFRESKATVEAREAAKILWQD